MVSRLEVQDIRENICLGKTTKEKGESGETSVFIGCRMGVKVSENKSNFCNRTDRDPIDSKEKSARQIFVIQVFICV